ncbi:TrbL/VirB6 plasmid conjugal transfer protein [Kribbella sp. VKM Ac-2500]|uniref:type IV secretion system protein n=1 Tax=Kribbella sp. VKM Ac-2500 TaxID=2512214 RepID=UPI0010440364|nr:type IV secretion system protein [Kribbella sp. VKM Ac-2500]TCN34388.1 TrbL/VirB6 plasmid conjugal transfer protein [Kribbella sp. VKM Ac-2500]
MRGRRKLQTALTTLAISFIITAQAALAADPDTGPTNPTGFGDLLPTPDLTGGDTRTLFESYSPTVYGLDFETSFRDPIEAVFNGYAHMVMMYILAITRAAISVGWWLFSFTDIKPLTDTASAAIGSVNTEFVGWLLPSALAFGAIAAYAQRRASGSAMGQLVWVFAAGLLATSFAVAPATWLNGVDGARQIGSNAVVGTSTQVLGDTVEVPIPWPEPSFSGTDRDTLLRKSGDATWRAFAATPWCVAEFGSIAACQRYGKAILDKGTDGDARRDYIDKEVSKAEGGGDAATVKWAKGDNPFGRVGVLTLGAIAATLFAFLTISLAFTALMAFVGCMLLLVVGVLFACLWAIPGRTRQWGMNWFEALLGLVLQSILALLVFSTTLALVTAVFGLTDTLGWLPVSGLAIAVLIAGFRLRRLFESMSTMMRPGAGSLLMGGMARRGAMTAVRRIMGAVGSRAASPAVSERAATKGAAGDAGVERATSVRVFRQAPALGAVRGAGGSRQRPAHELVAGQERRAIEASASPPGSTTAGRAVAQSGRKRDRTQVVQGATLSTAVGGSDSRGAVRRKTISVGLNPSGGASPSSAAPSSGGGGKESKRPRHARETRSAQTPARFEPRVHSRSASLRDGPPKVVRERRRSAAGGPRRFREYSSVTKDGVTVMVPTRR